MCLIVEPEESLPCLGVIALIDVIERDYPDVGPGQEAVIDTDAFPGREFAGKVTRVAPLLKETSRQARVEIEMPNPERLLKPGMFVRVRIEFDRHENATVVPLAALARRECVGEVETRSRFQPFVRKSAPTASASSRVLRTMPTDSTSCSKPRLFMIFLAASAWDGRGGGSSETSSRGARPWPRSSRAWRSRLVDSAVSSPSN